MDQTKTGKFIQTSRKQANMTQKELAELLGVSDKLISKWETGNGMPDISILDTLCQALHISVNELLSGEVLTPDNYSEKAEENIMTLLKDNETNKKANIMNIITGIVFFLLGILYLAVTTYGASPMLVPCYIDLPSFIILAALEFACILVVGAKTLSAVISTIRKTILPIGGIAMVFGMIGLFNTTSDVQAFLPGLAISVIPLLYALGLYLFAYLVDAKIKKTA